MVMSMGWRGWLVLFVVVVFILGSIIAYLIAYHEQTYRQTYNPELFGVGEPITARHVRENLSLQQSFKTLKSLGVRRLREWIWMGAFLINETTLNQTFAETLNLIVSEMMANNITVLGMSHDFPSWMTGIEGDSQAVPYRNMTPGSGYMKFLESYRESWKTLAEAFPDITMWEIGNEFNIDMFLHPPDFPNSTFSFQEKADITTDLLYYGSLGVHEGNPKAKTVLGGLAPDQIAHFLERLYVNIKSGQWPSKDPDDYFQIACWHPYLFHEEPTYSNWVIPNNDVYNVMKCYGDGGKQVFFSEFGYSDHKILREKVSNYLVKAFQLAKDNFPWLETIYWFRLIDPEPATISVNNPPGYGLINLDWTWKPAAYAYQSLAKGEANFKCANILVAECARAFGKRISDLDISIFGICILNCDCVFFFGVGLNRRQIYRMLKKCGYSDKAVKAILEWYK
ncbi:MAG: hypothetical protein QXJ63_03455 [Candidatus Bathyarchaeia archaeon]